MEQLTVQELEELIIVEEDKLLSMRPTDEGFKEKEALITKLRTIRADKINGEA